MNPKQLVQETLKYFGKDRRLLKKQFKVLALTVKKRVNGKKELKLVQHILLGLKTVFLIML